MRAIPFYNNINKNYNCKLNYQINYPIHLNDPLLNNNISKQVHVKQKILRIVLFVGVCVFF